MLEKTRGIILHQLKYSDSGIVVHVYTKNFGRLSMLVRGVGKKKSGKTPAAFQPLFILDLEIYFRSKREMQQLREYSVFYPPYDIYANIKKSSVAIFLGEVLYSILKEESSNTALFDYIEESVIYFDRCSENCSNFHIAFLAGLSSYLGFEPSRRINADEKFFDMLNGKFSVLPPFHGNYAGEEVSAVLASFFTSSYDSSAGISLNGKMRNEVLDTLVKYYTIHLPSLKKINSLDVLKQVFS